MEEPKSTLSLIWDKLLEWYELVLEMLPNFVLAILIVVVFYILARGARNIFRKVFQKLIDRKSMIKLMTSMVYIAVLVIGI